MGASFFRPAPLPADTKTTTELGTNFTAPKGWTVVRGPFGTTLRPPESAGRITIIDVPRTASAGAAVNLAWQLYRPGSSRKLKVATPESAHDGWDEAWEYDYVTNPNERLVLFADPQRAGANWTVAIVEMWEPVFEKRVAAVRLVMQSLRPHGYHRETFAGRVAHPLTPDRVAALQSFLRSSMQELGVPGVGYALIDHGKIVYEGGLGVRELGKPDPVDAHTLFLIASNTKGMTTLLLAELVDQHKLGWNEPVLRAFPAFRLGNPATTRQVLIKHLVCACTGLPRQDMEWLFNTNPHTPPAQTFATLATMQPTSPFGETYQYSNLMAAAAGYVAGHIVHPELNLGAAYDAAMQSMVFNPLAMHDTTFDFARALSSDHASPHDRDMDGHLQVARMGANDTIIPYRPAGGAWSSAHDLILYVQNELAEGRLRDGSQLLSPANLLIRRAPGVSIGEDQTYGMGLRNDFRSGVNVVHHGGALFGYHSDIMFIPGAQVGAVILTNSEGGGRLMLPFRRRLLELLYDGKPEAVADVTAAAESLRAALAADRKTLSIPPDPALTAGLAAHYTNGALGHIDVKRAGKALTFDFGTWFSRIATRKSPDGTVSFVTIDPTDHGIAFVESKPPLATGLILRDGQHEYRYAPSK